MENMVSLSSLFKDKIFRIPDYQRGYAWDKKQLDDFWDDLYNLPDNRYHYTGMLSLKPLTSEEYNDWDEGDQWLIDSGSKPYHVVDGQQRLTTSVILLYCLLEFAKEKHQEYLNGKSIVSIKEDFIVQAKKPAEIVKAYKFGYEHDNPSFRYLRYKIFNEPYSGAVDESFYTLNLQNAKDFFAERLSTAYEEKGPAIIEALYKKLVNNLQFNVYYISNDLDVFVAFETMNNRGKKLSNLEILKNRLIYLTTLYPDTGQSKQEKKVLRKNINEAWKEVYHQLGRNRNKPLDDNEYLRNHWTLFYKYTRNKGDDYITFLLTQQFTPKAVYGQKITPLPEESLNDNLDNEDDSNYEEPANDQYYEPNASTESDSETTTDDKENEATPTEATETPKTLSLKEISDYVNSLKELAEYWYLSNNPNDAQDFTAEERQWLNRLNHIGINYFRTLVVAAMINRNVTTEQRLKLFKSIEKFIFLCFRLAKYNANYNSAQTYKYARQLYLNEVNVEEIINFYNAEFDKNISGALNAFKADMARSFTNDDGFYSWYPRWYFLFEYEAKLSENRKIAKLDDWTAFTKSEKDKISIEHIFPQDPEKYYWRNNFRKYPNKQEQHALANSLGNLLALSQSINSSLQNDEFELKKTPRKDNPGYAEGSYSEMEVAKYADWTPETILERGLHLLSFMEERWGFRFPDENFKIAVLGLEFLKDNRPEVPPLVDIDYTVKDTYFSGKKGEIKVSEYLQKKNFYLVEFYDKLFTALKSQIPTLYETATKNYIALKCKEFSKNIAEIHLQSSGKKICVITKPPVTPAYMKGEILSDNYLWSLNYREYISEDTDYSNIINVLVEAHNSILSSGDPNEE